MTPTTKGGVGKSTGVIRVVVEHDGERRTRREPNKPQRDMTNTWEVSEQENYDNKENMEIG